MSTKKSLEYLEWTETHEVHVYEDLVDNTFHLECDEEDIKIPKWLAIRISNCMAEEREENEKLNKTKQKA
jgi:hypothetical protein